MAEIALVEPEHYHPLSVFLANFENDPRTPEFWYRRFHVWWDKNPSFSDSTQRGWLLLDRAVIVGFIGNIPTYFQLDGKCTTAYNATTWRVAPEYRNDSMSLFFRLLGASKDSILFDTTPIPQLIPVLTAFKFHPVPSGNIFDRLLVVNFDGVCRNLLSKVRAENDLLIAGGSRLLRTAQAIRLSKLRSRASLSVKEITNADSSFDDLWRRTRRLYRNTNVRTADVIRWYCVVDEDVRRTLFGCYKNNQLVGYIIYQSSHGDKYRSLECLDLWCDFEDGNVVESLVAASGEYARANSYDYVRLPEFNKKYGRYLESLGLFQDKRVRLRPAYVRVGQMLPKLDSEETYCVGYQGDSGFW